MTGGWQITTNPLGSVSLNGSTQALSIPANAAFSFAGDFTWECWVYPTSFAAQGATIDFFSNASGSYIIGQCLLQISSIATVSFFYTTTVSALTAITSTATLPLNTWAHLAVVRSGSGTGNLNLYINGVVAATSAGAVTQNLGSTGVGSIGRQTNNSGSYFSGYISNVRIVAGVAVYTGNFVLPIQPLLGRQSSGTNIAAITGTQTSLLLQTPNNANFITDSSANNFTLTNVGAATAATLNPFDFAPLGSVNFNGINQSLTVTGTASGPLDLATGAPNWTVECWFYLNNVTTTQAIFWKGGTSGSTNPSYSFALTNATGQWIVGDGGGGGTAISPSTVFAAGVWYHFALVRNGSSLTSYTNGVQSATTTIAFTLANTTNNVLSIGSSSADGSTRYVSGYISNFRITKGVAVYTGNFTPPSTPLPISQTAGTNISAVTGTQTSLLLQTPNSVGFIKDSSSYNATMTNNNTATVSGLTPFGAVPGFGWQMTS
jgi:Concanavalin A-like lectin/glucanases superfamily